MKRPRKLKIIYKYVGDESPERKRESEERLEQAYNYIFNKALSSLKEAKKE